MSDNLKELGKIINQTKRNSEAALRRYNAEHPKIERVRDTFDNLIPFEMEFNTERQDRKCVLDLFFNKPPPLVGCNGERYNIPCTEFILGPGNHLIQVTARYKPGSVVVFRNGTKLTYAEYGEYDPINGIVFVIGTDTTSVFNICYLVDSWVPCPPSFLATGFFGASTFTIGTWVPDYDLNPNYDDLVALYGLDFDAGDVFNSGAFTHVSNVAQGPVDSQAVVLELVPILPGDIEFPSAGNVYMRWTVSLTGTEVVGVQNSSLRWIGFGIQLMFTLGFNTESAGFYGENVGGGSGFVKLSNALSGIITVDNNTERGTLVVTGPGLSYEGPASNLTSIATPWSQNFQVFGTLGAGAIIASASMTAFEIGCSLQPPG